MRSTSKALVKPLSILLATLLIGALIGASVTGAIVRQRLDTVRAFASSDGFTAQLIKVIEPVSDEQQAAIEPLLRQAGRDIEDVVGVTRVEIFLVMEGLETALADHLTETQLQRLRDRRKQVRMQYQDRRGPSDTDG